jgi:hypothetical protein
MQDVCSVGGGFAFRIGKVLADFTLLGGSIALIFIGAMVFVGVKSLLKRGK